MKQKDKILQSLSLRINFILFAVITVLGVAFTAGLAYFVKTLVHSKAISDNDELIQYIIGISMSMMYLIFGILAVCIVITVRIHLHGLSSIAKAAEAISNGNFDAEIPNIRQHTEIKLLRDSFVKMQTALKQYMQDLSHATEQKVNMERDIDIAAQIQQGMLPTTDYSDREDIDVFGRLSPAKTVGGDLYDYQIRSFVNEQGETEEYLFFCIGDVSGKSIPAALVMTVAGRLFRNISRRSADAARICDSINIGVADGNKENMFCTMFVGVLNLKTGHLEYCNAGHNPPIIVRQGKAEFTSPEVSIPIGVDGEYRYTAQSAQLNKGDILFLYTDGVNEAENVNKELFGNEATLKAVSAASNCTSMKMLTANVLATVNSFADTADQSDDISMVAIKRT